MLLVACTSGCRNLPTMAQCVPGTYNSVRWPASYWVQPVPELEETVAHVPPGVFVLVRTSSRVEAIRFFDVMEAPSEGDRYGCASYDVYVLDNMQSGGRLRKRTGRVSEFATRGIHLFPYQPGRTRLHEATTWTHYYYPTQVVVGKASEVAVSAWTEISEVDPAKPALKWFRHDTRGRRTAEAVEFTRNALP
jgi:hypothetical protein